MFELEKNQNLEKELDDFHFNLVNNYDYLNTGYDFEDEELENFTLEDLYYIRTCKVDHLYEATLFIKKYSKKEKARE